MDRRDFAAIADRTLSDSTSRSPDGMPRIVRMTSGTTGAPLVFIRELAPALPGWFAQQQNHVICLGNLPMRLGQVLVFWKESKPSARLLVLDARDMSPVLQKLLADFQPDMVYAFPSIIARVLEHLDEAGKKCVRLVIMAGEPLYRAVQQLLKNSLPYARMETHYMIQEAGHISAPQRCRYLSLDRYHLAPGVRMKVFNADKTGAGELAVTIRVNDSISLKDYRYGDTVRIYDEVCDCGARSNFEIVGRKDADFIRFGGAILRREEFDRVFALCRGSASDYWAEFSTEFSGGKMRGKITLHVSAEEPLLDDFMMELGKHFSDKLFVTPTRTYGELIGEGVFAPISVMQEDMMPRISYKDIKLRRKPDAV